MKVHSNFSNILLCLFFYIIFTGSCKHLRKDENNFGIINLQIDSLISEADLHYSDLFSDFQVIPLETKENCIFSHIDNFKLINDTFYIFDRFTTKSVYLFSKEGNFLNKVCKTGRGPGEYIMPSDFDIDKNERNILIFDYQTGKLNFYNYQGSYIRNISFKGRYQSFILNEDFIYFFRLFPSQLFDKKTDQLLYQFNKKGEELSRHIKYSEIKKGPPVVQFFNGGNFFKGNNDVKFYMPFCDTIFSIKGNTIQPFMSLITNKYKVTENDLSEIKKNLDPMLLRMDKLSHIREYSENKNMAFFKFFINSKEYKTFYYFKSKKIICTCRLVDDLTFIGTWLFRLDNNIMLGVINPIQIPKFKAAISSGKVKLSEEKKVELLGISDYNNPIIVLYNVRENQD